MVEDFLIGVIPASIVVGTLTEFFKKLGVKGELLTLISVSIGALLSIGVAISENSLVTFGDWFNAIVFGVFYGVIASGGYDLIKNTFKNGVSNG